MLLCLTENRLFIVVFQFSLLANSLMFYVCFFDVRLPEDDLKKIETCRNMSGLYVEVYIF